MTAALDAASRRIPNLWDHLGLIITLLAGAIVLIRLLAAADWDQQLAMAILQASGTGNVLVGAVLSTLPHVLGMSLVLVLVAGRVPYQLFRHQRRPSVWDVSQLVLIVLVMALTSWTYYLILLVAALILGIVLGINDRTTPTTGRNSNVRLIASLLVVPTLSALLFSNTPWMARESLEFSEPATTHVGYVLSTSNDEVAVLIDSPRSIRYLPLSTLKKRDLCGERAWFTLPPIQLVSRSSASRPECPKVSA